VRRPSLVANLPTKRIDPRVGVGEDEHSLFAMTVVVGYLGNEVSLSSARR
jgi:hypothetical protein